MNIPREKDNVAVRFTVYFLLSIIQSMGHKATVKPPNPGALSNKDLFLISAIHPLWVGRSFALHQPHSGILANGAASISNLANHCGQGQGRERKHTLALHRETHYTCSHFIGDSKTHGHAELQKGWRSTMLLWAAQEKKDNLCEWP